MAAPTQDDLAEVELEPGTLVIGDLHLDVSPHGGDHASFRDWLRSLSGRPRLVILGDLFDAWVGPAHARLAPAHAVCSALADCVRAGCAVDVVHGNRDFLLDASFERATGARVHPKGFVGLLPGGRRVLFVHGDELCTLDRAYQRMKRVLRSPAMLWLAPRLPDALALWAARRLRTASTNAIAAKAPAEKEQQEGEVARLTAPARCDGLVCGHAHRFRAGPTSDGVDWWVLDDYGRGRDLIQVTPEGGLVPASSGTEHGAG